MDATWTDEQWQAIYEEGKNIIVSAGAGSGKTAVLTERVIRKLKDGIPINKLLILTFTKAAAEEMKDRIRKKIKKEPSLKENLNLLDSSYITTFDSFALSVVKKYHYLLNIPKEINIIDTNLMNIEKEKIIEKIFLNYYEEENPLFIEMINSFCTKDDTDIKNYIIHISNKLDLLSNKKEYLSNYIENYFNDKKIEQDINNYTNLILDNIKKINNLIEEVSYLDNDFSNKLKESIEILQEVKDYNDLKTKLNIKLPSSPRKSEEEVKEKRKEINEILKENIQLASYEDTQDIKDSILKTKNTIKIIIEIIIKLTEQSMLFKKRNNSYEFNDIAILAIKIVKEYNIAKEELTNLFQEIMIDEYQDTNDLQEEFISMISQNNTYMVGDIKQSIYRFRNANPYIFKNKYDTYQKSNKDVKIDLNKNFRSRKEVLDNINIIFNLIMNDTIGGANYLESHQMIFGNTTYLKETPLHSNDMEIWKYEYDKNIGFNKEEIEAFTIAKDIKEKVTTNYQILDKETSKLRNAKYEDFAIIMDRSTNFDLYKKIFNYFNIPTTLLKDEKMNDETDVLIIKNLIKLILKIKNKEIDTEFKYLFTSIERSFLLETKDEEILNYFENNNYKESILYKKCKQISKDISYISIHTLIDIILEEFNFYQKCITMGGIWPSIVKISKLKETASNLESLGYTIDDFSNYLEEILKNGYSIEYKITENNTNSVKIMTIHKSKGLEYPVCYFSGLYKEFNISDLKEKFLTDKKLGIIAPYFKEGINTTIYKELLKKDFLEEEISEKIRLFYVALTRAREKIILISPQTDKYPNQRNQTILEDNIKTTYRSLSDIIDSINFRIKEFITIKHPEDLSLTKDYNIMKDTHYEEKIKKETKDFTVDEIKIALKEQEETTFSKKIEKLITKQEQEKLNFGTKIHQYLEYLDFKNPNLNNIDNNFCKQKIEKLLSQPFLKNIKEATIYQEYEFKEEKDNTISHGIIDLMIEYNNHIDIIDYKLKNIKDKSYKEQLTGYKNYISNITNKPINIYLYSLLEEEFLKIE